MEPQSSSSRPKLSLLNLLPNVLTVIGLCAGLTAIRFAAGGGYAMAVTLIGLAAVLDGLDGRLARLLKSESAIGAELDSLADFVNFGIAPAVMLYFWNLRDTQGLGWIAVLVYAVCCMLRLARFNVGSRSADTAETSYFKGIPSPAGAMLVMMPMYLGFAWPEAVPALPGFAVIWMLLIGALMISKMPTPSLKSVTIYAEHAAFVVVGCVGLVAALFTYPWVTLLMMDCVYLFAILVVWRGRRREARQKVE